MKMMFNIFLNLKLMRKDFPLLKIQEEIPWDEELKSLCPSYFSSIPFSLSLSLSLSHNSNDQDYDGRKRYIKKDAAEYFEMDKLRSLITKHSEYGASPIFLWTETTTQEPVEIITAPVVDDDEEEKVDEGEVKIEEEGEKKVEMHSVTKGAWVKVNDMAPLWMR
jgi:hypothetical protein